MTGTQILTHRFAVGDRVRFLVGSTSIVYYTIKGQGVNTDETGKRELFYRGITDDGCCIPVLDSEVLGRAAS